MLMQRKDEENTFNSCRSNLRTQISEAKKANQVELMNHFITLQHKLLGLRASIKLAEKALEDEKEPNIRKPMQAAIDDAKRVISEFSLCLLINKKIDTTITASASSMQNIQASINAIPRSRTLHGTDRVVAALTGLGCACTGIACTLCTILFSPAIGLTSLMLKENLFASITKSTIVPNFLEAATRFKETMQANNPSIELRGLENDLNTFQEQVKQRNTENPFDFPEENTNPGEKKPPI